ncbi:MAG TPA: tetratricopeptide repeat protein, partial [Bacteroidota bacterium]|nr:tetratricopeptide repeat protein [Bacteroidota bacterium]
LVQFGRGAWENRGIYADYCKYITDRQVRTALWIRDHLPTDAVIGTHDVGAIAYYSGRRIVDMVGLVSPGMIENIGNFDRLVGFLGRNRVTHLAVLRNWFEVANQNPLFTTDEKTPEIMQVYTFDPLRCHFTPQNVSELVSRGAYHLSIGEVQTGGAMLEEALRLDPRSARANFHFGVALLSIGRNEEAERAIRTALDLQPDAWPAILAIGHFALKRGEVDSALSLYKDLEGRNPTYAPVYQALSQFYLTEKPDSTSAAYYGTKYRELSGTPQAEKKLPQ